MSYKSLKIIHWNANSIKNKINELTTLLNTEKIDIALIGKTRIKPSFPIKIQNYIYCRTDNVTHPGKTVNGSTAIFIHRHVIHRQVKINIQLNFTSIENFIGQNKIRISAVCKRPQNPLDSKYLDLLTNGCDLFIMTSDMNAKRSLWNNDGTSLAGYVLDRHVR